MSKWVIEFQMGGEIVVDTAGSDEPWTEDEVHSAISESLDAIASKLSEVLEDEFDTADISNDAETEYTLRRLS